MFRAIRSILTAVILVSTGAARAQSPAQDQVQAVIIGLHTPQQAHHVDELLRTMDGVLVSRTDLHTSNLFMLVRADSPMTRALVDQRLVGTNLEVRCWTRSPRTEAPFHHLDAQQCTALPHQK